LSRSRDFTSNLLRMGSIGMHFEPVTGANDEG
jgi:hypothetical protein